MTSLLSSANISATSKARLLAPCAAVVSIHLNERSQGAQEYSAWISHARLIGAQFGEQAILGPLNYLGFEFAQERLLAQQANVTYSGSNHSVAAWSSRVSGGSFVMATADGRRPLRR